MTDVEQMILGMVRDIKVAQEATAKGIVTIRECLVKLSTSMQAVQHQLCPSPGLCLELELSLKKLEMTDARNKGAIAATTVLLSALSGILGGAVVFWLNHGAPLPH
jgi:hypothetical protein